MKKLGLTVVLFLVFLCGMIPSASWASVDVNINFISGYYAVPAPTVVYYEDRLHSWQDVATLFFLSKMTGCSPQVILGWRLGGTPWVSIVQRLHVPMEVFYIPYKGDEDDFFEEHEGPPYGHAWGYWRKHDGRRVLVLDDAAIRNRVVLLGTSRYYGIPVVEEIRRVGDNREVFTTIIAEHRGHGEGHFLRDYYAHGKNIPFYQGNAPHEHAWKHEEKYRGHGDHGYGHGYGDNGHHGHGDHGYGHGENGHGHGDHGHGHGHGGNEQD